MPFIRETRNSGILQIGLLSVGLTVFQIYYVHMQSQICPPSKSCVTDHVSYSVHTNETGKLKQPSFYRGPCWLPNSAVQQYHSINSQQVKAYCFPVLYWLNLCSPTTQQANQRTWGKIYIHYCWDPMTDFIPKGLDLAVPKQINQSSQMPTTIPGSILF